MKIHYFRVYLHKLKTEIKMGTQTTIKTIVGNEYQGKTNYTVTLADGTVGYLQKESDTGLQNGDTVFAMVEDYTSKAGKQSKLITLKKLDGTPTPAFTPQGGQTPTLQPQRPAIHVGAGKSKEELKAEATIRVAEVLVTAFGEGKLESAQVSINVKDYGHLLWTEIDEIFSGK